MAEMQVLFWTPFYIGVSGKVTRDNGCTRAGTLHAQGSQGRNAHDQRDAQPARIIHTAGRIPTTDCQCGEWEIEELPTRGLL